MFSRLGDDVLLAVDPFDGTHHRVVAMEMVGEGTVRIVKPMMFLSGQTMFVVVLKLSVRDLFHLLHLLLETTYPSLHSSFRLNFYRSDMLSSL